MNAFGITATTTQDRHLAAIEGLRKKLEAARILADVLRRVEEASSHFAGAMALDAGTLRYAHESTRRIAEQAIAAWDAAQETEE